MYLRIKGAGRRSVLLWRVVYLWRQLLLRPHMQMQAGVSYAFQVDDSSAATQAITEALELHRGRLRAFVLRRTDAQSVEDVLQAAAMRALEKASTLKDPERTLAWLYQVHRTTILDLGRKVSARRRWETPDEDPACTASKGQCEVDVDENRCGCSTVQANALKPSYAEILQLVDMEEHSIAEVSSKLGISTNNVTVRLHRARAALREKMREHCGVERPGDCSTCRCTHDGCCAA